MKNNNEKTKGMVLIAIIVILILVVIMVGIIIYFLCNNGDVNNTDNHIKTNYVVNSQTNALAGVYLEESELVELNMGTEIAGVDTALCTVKVPLNTYVVTDDSVTSTSGKKFNEIINEEPSVLETVNEMIGCPNFLFQIENKTIADVKEFMLSRDDYNQVYKEKGDIGTLENPAYYYHYSLGGDRLFLNYQINDNYMLTAIYDLNSENCKKYVNEIGIEAFMENLYKIIKVL